MKRHLPWFSFVIAFYVQANAQQSGPLIDYHQHLFSPAIANLLSDGTVSPVSPPQELERLIAARARANRDDMVLEQLYTARRGHVSVEPELDSGRTVDRGMVEREPKRRGTPAHSGVARLGFDRGSFDIRLVS